MSRTDKDRPYWVRTNDPREDRVEHHNHVAPRWRTMYAWDGECHIDEPSTRENRRSYSCGFNLRYKRYWNPKKEDRRLYYYKPLRSRERDTLGKAAKQYNAGNEVDEDIVLPESHRHAMFPGGYWD
jgi:hypothetical protein